MLKNRWHVIIQGVERRDRSFYKLLIRVLLYTSAVQLTYVCYLSRVSYATPRQNPCAGQSEQFSMTLEIYLGDLHASVLPCWIDSNQRLRESLHIACPMLREIYALFDKYTRCLV